MDEKTDRQGSQDTPQNLSLNEDTSGMYRYDKKLTTNGHNIIKIKRVNLKIPYAQVYII